VKLLAVVQRYGTDVAGGAELLCRQLATRLAEQGHAVEVVTSCARSYIDWANAYPPGEEILDGVTVHRLPVLRPRDVAVFGDLDGRTSWSHGVRPLVLQRSWMAAQGPLVTELAPWLAGRAASFDAVIFFTYLYYSTWAGLPVAAERTATVLHPTAHREPQFDLPIFDLLLRLPTAYAYSTEEEAALVAERTGRPRPGRVIGIGVDLDATGHGPRFRSDAGLGERPYLLFVGRVVAEKGSLELYDYFTTYKRRRPGDLALVVMGDPLTNLPSHPDVLATGFVPESVKHDALDGALAMVQPSYFESFSMVLSESWAQGTAALVQGRCDVLAGQVARAGGGIAYDGYAEFEAAVDLLVANASLAPALGARGREFVQAHYSWDAVLGRYERLLGETAGRHAARRRRLRGTDN
jgi:glycosyltransferase involved in cell wall biosynthesis